MTAWYWRTPPAERVTWGGMIACVSARNSCGSRAIGQASPPQDHAASVHRPIPRPASRRQARLRSSARPLRAESEPSGECGARGGAALGPAGRRPGASSRTRPSGRDGATAAQRRDLAPDCGADSAPGPSGNLVCARTRTRRRSRRHSLRRLWAIRGGRIRAHRGLGAGAGRKPHASFGRHRDRHTLADRLRRLADPDRKARGRP